ncbi:MAG: tRNA (adenosine(37)-N6)-threonylcarbamoyltransferase complex ATPase subunit type 1 TsaE [Clostridiales bacterium]|nr:tRNA (adenosine(37)-N6)-threonylcarbamoyltransferase complex ATPase subunit type 1 TsaE [Clostridiales bacterium]
MPNDIKKVYKVKTARQMEELGKKMALSLVGGEVVLLTGELGAGKTVFCKGLAKGLGVTAPVVSPTFTIMNEYFGRVKFCHFDAYRLCDSDEAYAAGLDDFIGDGETVCAVEWWENIRDMFDGLNTVKICIEKTDYGREVTVLK